MVKVREKQINKIEDGYNLNFYTRYQLDQDGYVMYAYSWCDDLIVTNLFEKYPVPHNK